MYTGDTPEIRGVRARVFRSGLRSGSPATIKLVNERKIRILAVDHNALLREGISLLIGLDPGMELLGSATNASEAVQSFAQYRPDVTLMDLDLPSASGVAAIEEILKLDQEACVIGLLTYERDPLCKKAVRAGARTCLTKDRLNDELIPLIREEAARRRPQ